MKNLTVSVPEEVYRLARVRAAEAGSSISGLVTSYLRDLGDDEAAFSRLEAQQDDVVSELGGFRAGDRLSRDELHERAAR